MKKRWIVVICIAAVLAWGQYKKYQREAFEATPEGMNHVAMVNSIGVGAPIRSQTGVLYFGGFRCKTDCSGHQAGYDWAESFDEIDEQFCQSQNAPASFIEGCIAYANDLKSAAEESQMDRYSGDE
ncbi:hypothetical protein [Pseudocitrobacter vendiensis]|uniref:Uncharacterized protein n=1 Tax=Pseudocitrobacter vendiensis TaxID=2488306 RepID=A0ABM9FBQ7_9ENTR|nr:hypothetical protein [Pseudocitrobacter vendiensis]CAH6660633.1 hypothetical protein FBBNIHIM_16100 [Pseudocitrobacter vendiensis]